MKQVFCSKTKVEEDKVLNEWKNDAILNKSKKAG